MIKPGMFILSKKTRITSKRQRILTEHIYGIYSSDSKLHFEYICSIGIRSRTRDICEIKRQNKHPYDEAPELIGNDEIIHSTADTLDAIIKDEKIRTKVL